uniref:Uncharacterized protein n=1 Tax=Anser cygnoides TaxID=8845 RepID=A0A8B9EDG0_ANSCY
MLQRGLPLPAHLLLLHVLPLPLLFPQVVGPGHAVTATVGQDVVLPCHLSPQRDAHTLEVRWIRHSLSETVHHYHNGEDLYGDLDLRITGLRPSDDGQYICTVEDSYNEAIVELEVSATGVDSHLSLGGYEAGGVRVLCRSAGWYPLLQLLWRDARGQHLPSVSQTYSQDQEGLFEIEGSVIVTGSVEGPLSCVVRSSRLQQEWESSLHIAAPFFHNAQPWMVALALVLVLLAVSIGLGVYLFRKKGKLAAQGWSGGRCSAGTRVGLEREVPHLLPCGAAPGPELGKACPGLSSAPDGLAPSVPAVKVTLDADTAHPQLVLSQDNSSVRWETQKQQVSDTSERFDTCCCVLGREEFREGRHCWLVEVERKRGKYLWWAVGVARASVKRKKWIDVSPEEGIWAVQYNEGIWVCLDCTQGQVSFINADNGVEIFTFTASCSRPSPWFLSLPCGSSMLFPRALSLAPESRDRRLPLRSPHQEAVGHREASPVSPLLWAQQAKRLQPLLTRLALQSLRRPRSPPLEALAQFLTLHMLWCPQLHAVLEARPQQAQQSGTIPSLGRPAVPCLRHLRACLALWAARARCWLTPNLPSATTPSSRSGGCSPASCPPRCTYSRGCPCPGTRPRTCSC